jgi:hypothetical protein
MSLHSYRCCWRCRHTRPGACALPAGAAGVLGGGCGAGGGQLGAGGLGPRPGPAHDGEGDKGVRGREGGPELGRERGRGC